jgi:phosphoglycolate phosphatase
MATLIFDFDGTLADSFVLTVDVAHEVMGYADRLSAERIEQMRGLPPRTILREFGVRWWRIPALLTRGRKLIGGRLVAEVRPFPGVAPTLRKLHGGGHRLFVLSSNSKVNVDAFLHAHSMHDVFDRIYGDVGIFSKAGRLRQIIRENHLHSTDTWYVGDEVRDIIAAHQTGIAVAAVTWGFNSKAILQDARPDKIINKPQELVSLVS